jgi:hypothetical protein
MKELIVVSTDTYGSGLTLSTATLDNVGSLAAGAFAIFDLDPASANYGKAVDIAKATPDAVPAIFNIAWCPGTGLTPRQSQTIIKATAKLKQTAYVAPVAKIVQVGKTSSGDTTKSLKLPVMANLSPTVQIAGLRITDLSKPHYDTSRSKSYDFVVGTADTEATIVTGILALIAADSTAIVTGAVGYSGSTTSILLTGKTAGKNFEVSKNGVLKLADITISTQLVVGTGIAADLKLIENETLVEDGNFDPLGIAYGYHLFTAGRQIDASKTYLLNIFKFIVPSERKPIMDNGEEVTETIIMAMDTALTAAATGNSMNASVSLVTAFA